MSELREKVARAIAIRNYPSGTPSDIEDMAEGFMDDADAAIAAVLEAMQEPSETMLAAVVNEPTHLYGMDGRGAEYERDMKNAFAIDRLMKRQEWQAMLTAFRAEAMGEG